ncbi:MaoC family dehydratase N-terminal domain-containing protein [Rhodococcus sp. DMU1]|uniref:FAS1-like dehydratase domain-containing protein n=1 Tax=Rhodococcus sp. DMU1 TaxID=2722825 RepID=UPI00143EB82A|nr:MaoC family dehydratase N-terminal domain-containing protein [Rhodococcus sp. DMU1]QIX53621.1 MaoC family dehydratase [Rhodococcus sp. DMU1]
MAESPTLPRPIPDEAAAWIGRETWSGEGTVRAREFQRWALAVGETNPLYFDIDVAKRHGYPALVMPPMFLPMVVRPLRALGELRADGSVPEYDLPGLPERRMAGGDKSEFLRAILDGEKVFASRVLADIVSKRGRSGDFLLATWTTRYTDSDGSLIATTDFRLVAR